MEYTKKLIKLGKHSKALVIPINFLKQYSGEIKEVIVKEYPNKLIIKVKVDKIMLEAKTS